MGDSLPFQMVQEARNIILLTFDFWRFDSFRLRSAQVKAIGSVLTFDFRLAVLSTDTYLCIYLVYSYTDDLYRAEGVEMKCILIDCEQGDQELGEYGVEDRLFLTQS